MVKSGKSMTWVTVLLLVLLAGAAENARAQAQWGASVKIDTVLGQPGEPVGVPVRLINNSLEYAGLHIPLQVKSPYLTIDSVSKTGSILTADFDLLIQLPPGGGDTAELTVIQLDFLQHPTPVMPAIDGLIATLWVTVAEDAPIGPAMIDSLAIDTMLGPEGNQVRYWKFVNGSDPSGTTIMPGFIPGGVRVERTTGVAGDEGLLPGEYSLEQNYPNPFNPSTTIGFALPRSAEIRLTVFNLLGQMVTVAAEGRYPAGYHELTIDASAFPSGVYLYRLEYAGGSRTRKMLLLK